MLSQCNRFSAYRRQPDGNYDIFNAMEKKCFPTAFQSDCVVKFIEYSQVFLTDK